MVPPGSWSPAGTAAKPKTVPPVSSDRRQPGATRQSGGANWCPPPVRHAGSSPADSAWKPETVLPRFSPKQCHPSVRRHHADLRCHPAFRVPRWCHPSVCRVCAKMGPPAGSGASDRAIFGATPRSARQTPPTWCHPPVRHRQIRPGSPKQCHPAFRVPRWCHPSVCPSVPRWGHPPDRARRIGRSLGPRPELRGKGRMREPQHGATRQFARQFARVSLPNVRCHPPNSGGGSGIVAPGLSAQSCSRPPALVASGASPTAADCARWRP
jgi:hypothetical protein